MNEVMFLPTMAVEGFLKEETAMDKLRYAVTAMAEAHKVSCKLSELKYNPEEAEWAEPYAAIYGHNVPLLMDAEMLVDYLNKIENAFFLDADSSWGVICICYVPKEQRIN